MLCWNMETDTKKGDLYASIIDEVITAARADFQEEGVDEATLQDFRNVRLSSLSPMHSRRRGGPGRTGPRRTGRGDMADADAK